MSVRSFSEMSYYNALSLQALGKTAQAKRLLNDLLHFAGELLRKTAGIDYFATSLPAMLLFEDDPQYRRTVTARFLQAQARLAQGHVPQARQRLRQVLAMDGNHCGAADLLAELDARGHHAS